LKGRISTSSSPANTSGKNDLKNKRKTISPAAFDNVIVVNGRDVMRYSTICVVCDTYRMRKNKCHPSVAKILQEIPKKSRELLHYDTNRNLDLVPRNRILGKLGQKSALRLFIKHDIRLLADSLLTLVGFRKVF
jgi:hypothetical protein